jgi:hypothetical protein
MKSDNREPGPEMDIMRSDTWHNDKRLVSGLCGSFKQQSYKIQTSQEFHIPEVSKKKKKKKQQKHKCNVLAKKPGFKPDHLNAR